MKLKEFNSIIPIPTEYQEIEVTGLTNHSGQVMPGDLFLAIPGYKTNGFLYLDEAFRRGAKAALIEASLSEPTDRPLIPVMDIRKVQGLLAAHFYHYPSRRLRMIGVTGTNGKTTVTHLIQHLLHSAHRVVGLIGTVWIDDGFYKRPSERTTPDPLELQQLLAEMLQNGVETVVMEVSSHALALERVAGIEFNVGVLTNITHDHFDFHQNYQKYLETKLLLFKSIQQSGKNHKYGVINVDDPSSGIFAKNCAVPMFFYGTPSKADTRINYILQQQRGDDLVIDLFGEELKITTRLPGDFNSYNILAAITVAYQEGLSREQIKEAIGTFPGVPGRFQEVLCGQPFRVMVDFAHNPAALENILKMARDYSEGRRIIVFGCEGEKDRLKRPLMGKIALENSEIPILTSDNIYYEELEQIFGDVLKDLPVEAYQKFIVEPDRGEAIKKAIELAEPGDFIIVAGKGPEEYLIRGSEHIPFNDMEVLKAALASQHNSLM